MDIKDFFFFLTLHENLKTYQLKICFPINDICEKYPDVYEFLIGLKIIN